MRKALFIFRRDLRLKDNTGLIRALRDSEEVIPAFIFDPRQTGRHPYKSDNALQFLVASLAGLDRELRTRGSHLALFQGRAEKVVSALIRSEGLDAVHVNRDYTPFSRRRDAAIGDACREKNVAFVVSGDALLNEPAAVAKADGTPYTMFTPFFRAARALAVRPPRENALTNYSTRKIAAEAREAVYARVLPRRNDRLFRTGGRAEALRLLGQVGRLEDYERTRDFPAVDGTTGLSPHAKFGTISIREFHRAVTKRLGPGHPLLRQLYWRDFFTHVAFHFDRVFGRPFRAGYERLAWNDDPRRFRRWQEGTTGFPIVDAGMRQLNETGFMHNRVRMVCASFLVKDLRIDWREGEKYFATKLEDYDPCVNNGNWQWAASTGCDAAPYFRIFNPWLQQKRYDPEAVYIKRWLPELGKAAPDLIHRLDRVEGRRPGGYPPPIVDHTVESLRALAMYRLARAAGG
ncbi:MAG: deoxyribodipyrimidine photo-lyase [Candidatus Aminicenantes bacterium]|nr:MAG: deoxyribodipyrimidine photo-lyase [Candidatus Aminicenantes bacterium]